MNGTQANYLTKRDESRKMAMNQESFGKERKIWEYDMKDRRESIWVLYEGSPINKGQSCKWQTGEENASECTIKKWYEWEQGEKFNV